MNTMICTVLGKQNSRTCYKNNFQALDLILQNVETSVSPSFRNKYFRILRLQAIPTLVEGVKNPGEKGAGEVQEAKEDRARKQDCQGGGNREKLRKILQHCAIFCEYRNSTKWRESLRKG